MLHLLTYEQFENFKKDKSEWYNLETWYKVFLPVDKVNDANTVKIREWLIENNIITANDVIALKTYKHFPPTETEINEYNDLATKLRKDIKINPESYNDIHRAALTYKLLLIDSEPVGHDEFTGWTFYFPCKKWAFMFKLAWA